MIYRLFSPLVSLFSFFLIHFAACHLSFPRDFFGTIFKITKRFFTISTSFLVQFYVCLRSIKKVFPDIFAYISVCFFFFHFLSIRTFLRHLSADVLPPQGLRVGILFFSHGLNLSAYIGVISLSGHHSLLAIDDHPTFERQIRACQHLVGCFWFFLVRIFPWVYPGNKCARSCFTDSYFSLHPFSGAIDA